MDGCIRPIGFADEHAPAAEAAVTALREQGFGEVQLDRINGYDYDPSKNLNQPGRGEASGVTATFGDVGGLLKDDTRVLLGAFPENSGMAGAPAAQVAPFLVTVVTTENALNRAVQILQQHGARV